MKALNKKRLTMTDRTVLGTWAAPAQHHTNIAPQAGPRNKYVML